MKKLFGLLLLTAFALAAGELDGKWSGKFDITHSDRDTKADSAYMNLKLDGYEGDRDGRTGRNQAMDYQERQTGGRQAHFSSGYGGWRIDCLRAGL